MSDNELVKVDILPILADDTLLAVAAAAEKRIEAVIKIKQLALRVTNSGDWIDQNGKPYIMASGSEKIANLFSISWKIDEPTIEQEESGHYTYTYKGEFSLAGRTIEVLGSRSSKDPFFKKYEWINDKKVEKGIDAIDRRDVKMAALTNLLGNGITRVLGIRNLSYDDLKQFAGITREMLGKVEYKSKKPETKPPQTKQAAAPQNGKKSPTQLKNALVIALHGDTAAATAIINEIAPGKDAADWTQEEIDKIEIRTAEIKEAANA